VTRTRALTSPLVALTIALPAASASGAQGIPVNVDDRYSATAERFVRRLQSGDFAAASSQVSSSVPAGAMSADRLAQIWAQLTGQLGTLTALEAPRSIAEGHRHVANLRARFARSEVTVRVVLDAEARVAGLWITPPAPPAYAPPAYVDSSAFREAEVVVARGDLALPGTVAMPKASAPVPIAVLVHGSGPSDRDETIGANRPFRDIAWGLASRGIAVLRYDKRTYVHGARLASAGVAVTPETEVIDDALAALAEARAQRGVDAQRVYLIGHSLGAALAPEIARRDGRLAGIVLLAAPARPIVELTLEQLAHLRGVADEGQRATLDSAASQLRRLARREAPADEHVLGAPASYWYDLDRRDPMGTAQGLRIPIFVVQGGRDYQVTVTDYDRWREALRSRGQVTFQLYPNLNHLFMAGSGTATPAEYTATAGHVAPEVVVALADWISLAHSR
jgi:dienelactone hydrolase